MLRSFISILILLSCNVLISQVAPDQVLVNYTAQDKSLKEVLIELSNITGTNISFADEDIPGLNPLTIQYQNQTLDYVLLDIFDGTNLNYRILGNQIVIFSDPFILLNGSFTISGYVKDGVSGEKLIFASVYTDDKTRGVQSNEFGFYSLSLPPGKHLIHYSFLGYEKEVMPVSLKEDTSIVVELGPNVLLNEILILDEYTPAVPKIGDADLLDLHKMQATASLGGEADIIRFAHLQPGVLSGSDGFGGMHVRGGEADQNLVLLDGVPVYHAGHALGILSIFNPSAIKSATLYKNGFPARYSGRLSSVLDVWTKEGSTRQFQSNFTVGTAAVSGIIEGPISVEKSSFMISGRRTFLDPWIRAVSEFQFDLTDDAGSTNYYFYDLNGKLNFKLGKSSRLFISGYLGGDHFENQSESTNEEGGLEYLEAHKNNWDWGNRVFSARINSILGPKLFMNLTALYSQFDFKLFDFERNAITYTDLGDSSVSYFGKLFDSNIQDIGFNADLSYIINPAFTVHLGANAVRHQFAPGVIFANDEDGTFPPSEDLTPADLEEILTEPMIEGYEYGFFWENDIRFGELSRLNIGLHAMLVDVQSETFHFIEPRLSLALAILKKTKIKVSLSSMNQYLHLLSNSGLGLPNDVWLPSTSKIRPQNAMQGSAGFELNPNPNWSIEFLGFYKKYKHIITYPEGGLFSIVDTEDWEDRIPAGKGRAYGLEAQVRRNLGKFSGWVNYTYSHSLRTFEEINGGVEFASKFDRKHNINMSWVYRFNPNAEFTFNWVYGSGNPATLPTDIIQNPDLPDPTLVFGDRNNALLEDYHRLDLSFNFYNKYKWGQQKLSIGLYNAYNRRNPVYHDIRRNQADPGQFEFIQISIFPILPTFSYSLAF